MDGEENKYTLPWKARQPTCSPSLSGHDGVVHGGEAMWAEQPIILKKHHMRHHFMGEDGNFGVTTPLWDHVLDTRIGSAGRVSAKAMRELPVHPAE